MPKWTPARVRILFEQDPESKIQVRGGAGPGVNIKVCAGVSQNKGQ